MDISDPEGTMVLRGAVDVPGVVADRFKLDAYGNVLRVVSNQWDDGRQTYLTTVNLANPDSLAVMATLPFERASGDTLFATRFDGARAYVVTYLITDPLFVLDLSDPYNPRVEGELEVPGWSTYIEPQGDYLITLGVDNTEGQRVSVSLFNVASVAAPSLVDRVSFGEGWSWSSAYNDVKAFAIYGDVLAVPFSGWTEDVGGFERLQFVTWSPEGLDVRGYVDLQGELVRSLSYEELYFGLTAEELAAIDASDLDAPLVENRLALAEHVADFAPLDDTTGVEVITQYATGNTLVRAKDLPMKASGEIEVDVGELSSAFAYGSSVILVGVEWPQRISDGVYSDASYIVAKVDFTNPAAPQLDGRLEVDVSPYYGYWRYPMPLLDSSALDGGIYYPYWYPSYEQQQAFIAGGRLVLRCMADAYDATVGAETPGQGIAVVSFSPLALERTIALGYERVDSVDAAGEEVIVGTSVSADADVSSRPPRVAHYVALLDIVNATAGASVNVPGEVAQYEPDTGLLILRDYQWGLAWDYSSQLRTARWDGAGDATLLDSINIPDGAAQVIARGERVYMDVYQEGYKLYAARIGAFGGITLGEGVLATEQWGSLVGATEDAAYVTIGNGAIARYSFAGPGELTDLVEVMGVPSVIRFGASQAYAPLGYFGIATLPL